MGEDFMSVSNVRFGYQHRWSYCDHCDCRMVICGKCGNNCCNGGYGEVDGLQCDACPEAYAMQQDKREALP